MKITPRELFLKTDKSQRMQSANIPNTQLHKLFHFAIKLSKILNF